MATLLEGQEYGLASSALSGGNKTVIHFKLTDTALKTVENFSKNKNGGANIQFHGNQGIIKIPSHGNQPERTFQISLSSLPGDLNGSFDCIQQTTKSGKSSLHSLGTMLHRVSVNATDDVYDRTRAKMTLVEEESKKVCTKEIKPSGRHISKKVKKILPPGSVKIPPPLSKPSTVSKSVSSLNRQSFKSSSSSSSPQTSSVANSGLSASTCTLANNGQHRHSPNPSSTVVSSKPPSSQSRVLTSSTTKQSSGAINMPYRDRVIHLLALKPYKKPELILRLQKDGIREKDKNSLGSVLQQVATLNRDNSYTLARGAWADVQLNWPFYSEQDRVLLKKNLQQESRAAPTSPAVSPASSNPESPGSSQKRSFEEPEENVSHPVKKKRIAHADRRQDEERPVSVVKPMLTQQSSPTSNRENFEGNGDDNTADKPDYISHFVHIKDSEQRQQYKHEFNKQYPEYRKLHQEVGVVARKFHNLRTQMDQTEEGTPDFEILKKQVLEEYEAQQSDLKFTKKKQRIDYLHQKLSHIKRLINDFDESIQPSACS